MTIGNAERERVVITVLGREHPSAQDFDDGNWLVARVAVAAGAWSGECRASLRSEEFAALLAGVRELERTLRGEAAFAPLEPWLTLRLEGDGLGHVTVSGRADDDVAIGNKLHFHFELDQTYLGPLIKDLEAVMTEYPVIGARG